MMKSLATIALTCLSTPALASQINDEPSKFQQFTAYISKILTCSCCKNEVESKYDEYGDRIYTEHEIDLMIKFATQLPLGDGQTERENIDYVRWPD